MTEDNLVQRTTAEYLHDQLGWETVYAYDQEGLGRDSLLGRKSEREVVLTRYLRRKLVEFNSGLPDDAYDDAVRQIVEISSTQTVLATNRDKHDLFKGGVEVIFRNTRGAREKRRLQVFDFDEPTNNHFLAVRELWVKGDLYRRRPDIIGFTGTPLFKDDEITRRVFGDYVSTYDFNRAVGNCTRKWIRSSRSAMPVPVRRRRRTTSAGSISNGCARSSHAAPARRRRCRRSSRRSRTGWRV
jgi:type I restriction enzyme R subunit